MTPVPDVDQWLCLYLKLPSHGFWTEPGAVSYLLWLPVAIFTRYLRFLPSALARRQVTSARLHSLYANTETEPSGRAIGGLAIKRVPGEIIISLLLIDKMSSSVLSQQWPRCLLIMLTGNESNKDLRRSDNTTGKTEDWPRGWCQMDSVTNKPLMSCLCFECNAFNLSSPGDNLLPAESLSVTQMSSTGFKNQFGEEMWELTGPDVSVIIVYWQPGGKF